MFGFSPFGDGGKEGKEKNAKKGRKKLETKLCKWEGEGLKGG